ncbi:MAG TPA: hypothetical protein VLR93_09820 [Patescibacteria group bacterium]|nr:hypothetical protein [Patescibacteria group bacterium]
MTNQLILGIAVVVVALLIAYEAVETWRWEGFANRPPSRFRVVRGLRRAIAGLASIVTLRRWRKPPDEPWAPMTDDDLAYRLGESPSGPVHLAPGRIVVSGARVPPPQPLQAVVPLPPPVAPRPSRLRLARDMIGAALVMGGFVVVFANLMPPSGPVPTPTGGVDAAFGTPLPSLEIRTAAPATAEPSPLSEASIASAPSPSETVLVSSTPTPTTAPTRAPRQVQPTAPPPIVTPAPTPTPKPTAKPTKKPKPTPAPEPAPRITSFDASPPAATAGEAVSFSYQFSHGTGCAISFDDGSGTQNCPASGGSGSVTHAFESGGTFNVVLNISGPGGSDTAVRTVVVVDVSP